jgi:anti-sigma B factor antagonist
MTFSTSLERRGAVAIVSFEGDFDIVAEAQATADLEQALDGADLLVADLRGLSFLDSTGVRVLLSADLRAREHGSRFGVVRGEGMVRRLLEVTGLNQRFPIAEDADALIGDGAAE